MLQVHILSSRLATVIIMVSAVLLAFGTLFLLFLFEPILSVSVTVCYRSDFPDIVFQRDNFSALKCDTLRHTATHCDTLQHTATYCNTPARRPQCTQPRHRRRSGPHSPRRCCRVVRPCCIVTRRNSQIWSV